MALQKFDPADFQNAQPSGLQPLDSKQYQEVQFDIPESDAAVANPGALGIATRGAIGNVLPAVGGVAAMAPAAAAGAELGATIGSLAGPVGTAVGGFVGGVGGGLAGAMGAGALVQGAQNKVFDTFPGVAKALGQSPEQQQADEAAHPLARMGGELLPQALMFRPSVKGLATLGGALHAAGNAALAGTLEAGQEYHQDGKIDLTKVGIQAAAGALLNKETPLGASVSRVGERILPSGMRARAEARRNPAPYSADEEVNNVPNPEAEPAAPVDLLRLSDQRAPRQGAPETLHPAYAENAPVAGLLPTPEDGAPRTSVSDNSPAIAAPGEVTQPQQLPTDEVKSLFDKDTIKQSIATDGVTDATTNRMATRVAQAIASENEDEFGKISKYLAKGGDPDFQSKVEGVIDSFKKLHAEASAKEEALTRPEGAPNPDVVQAVQQSNAAEGQRVQGLLSENEVAANARDAQVQQMAAQNDAARQQEFAQAEQQRMDSARNEVLKRVLDDPNTTNPYNRFEAVLKRVNEKSPGHVGEPAVRDYEKELIDQYVQHKGRQAAIEDAFTDTAPPENGTASMEASIPEAGVVKEPTPKAAPVQEQTPKSRYAPENFKLENYSEEDLNRMDAAQLRRAIKAQRAEQEVSAPAPKEPKQGELFTPSGRATKAATNVAKKPAPEVKPVEAKPEPEQKAVAKVEPKEDTEVLTHEDVVERADKALDDKLITAKQFQMVSIAAESGRFTPEEVHAELNKLIDKGFDKGFASKFAPVDKVKEDVEQQVVRPELAQKFRAELDRLGLHEVGIRVLTSLEGDKLLGEDSSGMFDDTRNLIAVAMRPDGRDEKYTLSHEAVHAMEHLGLIRDQEKATLLRHLEKDQQLVADYEEAYKNAPGAGSPGLRAAELIAEGYARWKEDKLTPNASVNSIYKKIEKFLDALGNMLRGHGFQTAEDVFNRIDSGEAGARERGASTLGRTPYHSRFNGKDEDLPPELAKPAANVKKFASLEGKPASFVAAAASTQRLTSEAARLNMPAARKLERLKAEAQQTVTRMDRKIEDIHQTVDKLPENKRSLVKGSIHDFLQRTQFTPDHAWPFKPEWLDPADYKFDPANPIAQEFSKLSKPEQVAVKSVMQGQHESHVNKLKALMENVSTVYDPLIANAKARGNADDVTSFEAAKKLYLSKFYKMVKTDTSKPYSSLRGFGDYTVVGTSDQYRAAEAEAKKTGDWSEVEKLQKDGDHYFVHFMEKEGDAERLRQSLESTYDNVERFKKSDINNMLYGGHDMGAAFSALTRMMDEQGLDPVVADTMKKLLTDMRLETLANASSRKSEITRRGIMRGNLDMVRAAITQMRGDARFAANIQHSGDILDAIRELRDQASVRGADRDTREKYAAELVKRHQMDMNPPARNWFANWMSNASTYQMLMTSPGYVLQQMLQNPAQTLPYLAGEHGAKAYPAMAKAMAETIKATKNAGITGPLNLDNLNPNHRALAKWLESMGKLDVGLSQEAFKYRADEAGATGFRKMDTLMRNFTRRGEALNRLTAGITAYDLNMTSGKPIKPLYDPGAYDAYVKSSKEAGDKYTMSQREFAAAYKAMDAIDNTHYDYSNYSKPRFMRGPVAQVVGQFKTFPMRQAELYAATIRNALDNTASPEERAVAQKTLAFMLGHAAVLAGTMGLPAVGLIKGIAETVLNLNPDKDKPANVEEMIRKQFGPDHQNLADLLLHGAPTLAGLNLTGSMGQGNLLSLTPYSDLPTDEKTYDAMLTAALGPTLGGVGPAAARGIEFASNGDYYKALEQVMPKGFANLMKAYREGTEGITNKRGEVTTPAADIGPGRTIATALGLQTTQRTRESDALGQKIATEDMFAAQTSRLKREYIEAARAKDTASLADLRKEWLSLQAKRAQDGYSVQPLSNLMKAPGQEIKKERQTVGGLQYGTGNRRAVQALAKDYALDAEDSANP